MTREELVGKMCEVFDPLSRDMAGRNPYKQAMAAALDVAVGELLPDPTECDYEKELDAVEASWDWDHQSLRCAITQSKAKQMIRDAVCIFWTNRRSRYLKPKSAEGRVVVKVGGCAGIHIDVDGRTVFSCKRKEDAEIYRLGLIQQLKEQEAHARL